jgi:hypothetical protein
MTAYRIDYQEVWDPAPVLRVQVVVTSDGGGPRVYATVTEQPLESEALRRVTRHLGDDEWRTIAQCWESYSLLWETGAPIGRLHGFGVFGSLTIEAVRGSDHVTYEAAMDEPADARLRDCARRMIVASGIVTQHRWWWFKPDEGACTDGLVHPVAGEPNSIDGVFEPYVFRGTCPEGMSQLTITKPATSGSVGHTFCLDYEATAITCADWAEADEYCRSRGRRLPTQEEWQWAVEGSPDEPFPWNERGLGIAAPHPRGGRFRQDVNGGIAWAGWGGLWEWTSGGTGPDEAVIEEGRVDRSHNLAIHRASRSRSYRSPLVSFRCAR